MTSAPSGSWVGPLLILSLFLLPWTILSYGGVAEGSTTLLFAWGLFDPATGQLTVLFSFLAYTRGLPDWLLAWPVGVGCLVAALASVALEHARGRGDDPKSPSRWENPTRRKAIRVTAALLVLVGLAVLSLSWGFSIQPGRTGLPVGTAIAWLAAGWYWLRYRALR